MQILDGNTLSQQIRDEIKEKVSQRKARGLKVPHLAAILVGDDPASHTYVAAKIKNCEEVGFGSSLFQYDDQVTEEEILSQVKAVNENNEIDGLIVQLPLPKHINVTKVIESISPEKDVDGFHPVNIGRMVKGIPALLPATPLGVLRLLEHYNIETKGKHCVVVGRSQIVGTPMSILMSRDGYPGNATVTLCHRYSTNLKEMCRLADIIITAVGQPGLITEDMVKEGAVVVDVGTTRVADASKKSGFRLRGDVDFDNVKDKCSYITPVPGGVGPMTRAGLLLNTLIAVEMRTGS